MKIFSYLAILAALFCVTVPHVKSVHEEVDYYILSALWVIIVFLARIDWRFKKLSPEDD